MIASVLLVVPSYNAYRVASSGKRASDKVMIAIQSLKVTQMLTERRTLKEKVAIRFLRGCAIGAGFFSIAPMEANAGRAAMVYDGGLPTTTSENGGHCSPYSQFGHREESGEKWERKPCGVCPCSRVPLVVRRCCASYFALTTSFLFESASQKPPTPRPGFEFRFRGRTTKETQFSDFTRLYQHPSALCPALPLLVISSIGTHFTMSD